MITIYLSMKDCHWFLLVQQ